MEYVRTEVINDKFTDDENSDVLSEFQGSVLWTKRSLLYRLSFMALLVLFALFLLGFSSPFWMTKHQVDKYRGYYNIREKVDVSIGLWRVCEGTSFFDITDCTVIPDITHYFVVCQTLFCLCLTFTVFSLIFGMYENCAIRYDVDDGSEVRTKRPEINAVSAGIFGLAGSAMYGTSIIDVMRNGEGGVHWAFLVTAGSVLGMIVCGILMAFTNPIHSATHSFPVQGMSLSRQNSLKVCEPIIQSRLVHSGDSLGQAGSSQASGTTYGGTGSIYDIKQVKFLKRSQSSLSSHMISRDMSPKLGMRRSDSQSSTYIIETRDIHTRSNDSSKQPGIKLYNKAVYKKSWRFGDKDGGAKEVVDLKSNPSCDGSPTVARAHNKSEDLKSLVSRWRDTLPSAVNLKGPLVGQTQESVPNEMADLMVLDDPLEEMPTAQTSRKQILNKDAYVVKRSTNSLLEDNAAAPSHLFSDLQRSTISSGSWENQPWPEPPTENETPELQTKSVPINNRSDFDCQPAKTQKLKFKNAPDSHQCQFHSKKHNQDEDSNISYKAMKSNEQSVKSFKSSPNKADWALIVKKSAPLYKAIVAARAEYDNPIFKSQPQGRERAEAAGDNLPDQIRESTSSVLPSYQQSSLLDYYTANNTMQFEQDSHRTSRPTHNKNCFRSEDPDFRLENSTHFSNGQTSPLSYNKFGKKLAQNPSKENVEVKDNSKPGNTQQQHQKMDVKSRPRKGIREQQQTGSGQLDLGLMQKQKLISPAGQRNKCSPPLASKLPKLGVHKRECVDTRDRLENDQGVSKQKVRTEVMVQQRPHDSKTERHYYATREGGYRDGVDSDN